MKTVRALTRFAFFVLALLLPERVFCEATMQQILANGPNDKRINIVMLSEGYTTDELEQFPIDAQNYLDHLLATPPFDEYRSYFNGFIISVASAESGSDHPRQNDYRDTYFNSSFGTDLERLMSVPYGSDGRGKVDSLLREFIPGYDLPILLVNDNEFGGAGGTTTIVSRSSLSAEAAVHELGHTLAQLDDEYSSAWSGAGSAERANSTQETRREFIKWHTWIDDSTPIPTPETTDFDAEVGLFEGAHYHDTGWYRPKYNCKMNTLGAPFCDICKEALVLSFYSLLNAIDSFSPPNLAVTVANEPVELSVEALEPETHRLDIQWFIDETPVTGAVSVPGLTKVKRIA
ncbi:MAG: M64 family metallopeptidase, partial [Verrucomicrobiota bacterium]